MYKLRPFLPMKVMKNVYYSLTHSHIIYVIEIWGSAFKTELDKILILQKRAIRLMTYISYYPRSIKRSSDQIFAKLKFMKVEDKYQVSKFMLKCLNHTSPERKKERMYSVKNDILQEEWEIALHYQPTP